MNLGGWDFEDVKAATSLPEKVASAASVLAGLIGSNIEPIAYVGKQVVNGTLYAIICKQTIISAQPIQHIVLAKVLENNGSFTIASIEQLM